MAKCKGCGAEIVFVRTGDGKLMPCNPDLYSYWQKKGGKDKIVTPNGEVVSCELHGDFFNPTGVGYIPHWATCPAADQFRKKGAAK